MLNVSTSEVYNEVDKKKIRLYVEWMETHFKIILLSSTMELLIGEMSADDIKYYSDELSKSSGEYLEDIKNAFTGKGSKVQFFLRDDTFAWKRKMWTLGKIKLQRISEIQSLACIFGKLLARYEDTQERLVRVGLENNSLKKCNEKLAADIREMTTVKDTMEKQLYKKFLLILNCKKKKIRELDGILKSVKGKEKSVYEKDTDESDASDEEDAQSLKNDDVKSEKWKLLRDGAQSSMSKVKKTSTAMTSDVKSDSSPRASTSKDSVNEIVRPRMPLSDNSDTDCELELKYADDSDPLTSTRRLSFTEELEEDLFAQS